MLPCGQLGLECCGKAAAFVLRRRLAVEGHYRIGWWCLDELICVVGRDVALRAIGFGVLRQSRSFRAAKMFGDRGTLPNWLVVRE